MVRLCDESGLPKSDLDSAEGIRKEVEQMREMMRLLQPIADEVKKRKS